MGRPNPIMRAFWIVSIHVAPTDRSTQMVGIHDVARQAFYAYHDHFFHHISQDERCYYPRHHRGELAARNASAVGKPSNQMNPTVQLLAITNTELNASLVEMRQLRLQAKKDRRRIAQLEA